MLLYLFKKLKDNSETGAYLKGFFRVECKRFDLLDPRLKLLGF